MRFVYKHKTGKYLKFENWSKINVVDVTDATIFNDNDLVPHLTNYIFVNYEKELRKLKLLKLYEKM